MQKSKLVALSALTLFALSPAAQAREGRLQQGTADAYLYDFEPDDLVGETLSTTPPLLKLRPRPLRVMLLRPRASFVDELLKSVEAAAP